MVLGQVVGSVVSTQKEKLLEGVKFLIVERIDPSSMNGSGEFVIAIDGVGAGEGEVVFYVSGSSARMTEVTTGRPADATITAIVESIELGGSTVYSKSASGGSGPDAGGKGSGSTGGSA